MRYSYDNINLVVQPQEFDKNSGKEILQYAVGGLLYMPASNKKIAKKIIDGTYFFVKSMVLDLEDSLGDDMVGYGQRQIVQTVNELKEAVEAGTFEFKNIPLIFVRIREFGQMQKIYEMLGDDICYITGFNIPKFDKDNCNQYIKEFKKVKSKTNSDLYIMPIIENKTAMYRQLRMENLLYVNDKLREIQDSVLNIRVGGADFCSIYGIRRGMQDDIYDIGVVRSVLNDIINVFGKSYVVSAAVWEYFENKENKEDTRWREGLEKELYADRLNGFIGKTSIHPSQLCTIQKSLIVNENDYKDAIAILSMNENIVGVSKSINGNRMNEVKTHTNWARKVVGLAHVYGVKEGD